MLGAHTENGQLINRLSREQTQNANWPSLSDRTSTVSPVQLRNLQGLTRINFSILHLPSCYEDVSTYSVTLHVQLVWQQSRVVDLRHMRPADSFVLLSADWPSDLAAEHAVRHKLLIHPRTPETHLPTQQQCAHPAYTGRGIGRGCP